MLNLTNNTHFQSLEVVYRASETQLQVAENLFFLLSALRASWLLGLLLIWSSYPDPWWAENDVHPQWTLNSTYRNTGTRC